MRTFRIIATRFSILAALAASLEASAFYDSNVQRWVNRDPIREKGGVDLYRFGANAPNRFVDAYGFTIVFSENLSSDQVVRIMDAINILRTTSRGSVLVDSVENSAGDVLIADGPNAGAGNDIITQEGTPNIGLNMEDPAGLGDDNRNTSFPEEMPPPSLPGLAVTIAHEIGHLLRYLDEAPLTDPNNPGNEEFRNVAANENPVRLELGLPLRTYYHRHVLNPCFLVMEPLPGR